MFLFIEWSNNSTYLCGCCEKEKNQLALEQHGLEMHGSIYTRLFFFQSIHTALQLFKVKCTVKHLALREGSKLNKTVVLFRTGPFIFIPSLVLYIYELQNVTNVQDL